MMRVLDIGPIDKLRDGTYETKARGPNDQVVNQVRTMADPELTNPSIVFVPHSKGSRTEVSANVISGETLETLVLAADAVDLVARFHDREPDVELISGLKANPVAAWFDAFMAGDAPANFDAAVSSLPEPLPQDVLDDLAAEYADIFLTHGYRAAPNGSVWLTEDRIERQEPMFQVRGWYDHYHVKVPDWRTRADDHIVHEMQFVAHLLRLGTWTAAEDAARFLDENLLPWLPKFADCALVKCRHRFFASVMEISVQLMEHIRDRLEMITGIARPRIEETQLPKRAQTPFAEQAYYPGFAESW